MLSHSTTTHNPRTPYPPFSLSKPDRAGSQTLSVLSFNFSSCRPETELHVPVTFIGKPAKMDNETGNNHFFERGNNRFSFPSTAGGAERVRSLSSSFSLYPYHVTSDRYSGCTVTVQEVEPDSTRSVERRPGMSRLPRFWRRSSDESSPPTLVSTDVGLRTRECCPGRG